LLRATFGA
jgi:hypothetical protein